MEKLAREELTRKERLRLWLSRQATSAAAIARTIGEEEATVRGWFRSQTMPSLKRKRLERLGIPPDLLPVGLDRKRGPRRKNLLALPPGQAEG